MSKIRLSRTQQRQQILTELLNLKVSPFYKDRIKNHYIPVIGEGSVRAKIMIIGEAPGKNEALTGRPFSGAAGKLLDSLLESIQLKRSDVYITNLVNDRPPLNRDPLPKEIKLYAPFLLRQINSIKPKALVTLGRFPMQYIFEEFGLSAQLKKISEIHGQVFFAKADYGKITIIPLYHPAAALYRSSMRTILQKDMQILKQIV